ncbi:MAG: DUF547 domain-containing protein [Bacteroidota bacterium]
MRALVLLAVFAASSLVRAQPAVEAPLDRVLSSVVQRDGRVDYARLARDRSDLDAALGAIARQDPGALRTDAQRTAFLINAYNAHVLDRVLAHPRASNIERGDLFSAFFRTPIRVAGQSMTLDQLEHGVLRRQARVNGRSVPQAARRLRPSRIDARIHAALNCAAISCPPLRSRAYRASTLDRDLGRQFSAWLASDRAARMDGRTLVLSSLFDWFASDFEGGQRLGDALLRAMPQSRARRFRDQLSGQSAQALRDARRVRFAYDWTINRAR